MMHICVSKLTIIGSDNGLSPSRRQAIIWTNAWILLIGPNWNKLQWNSNRNLYIFIQENLFENVVWKKVPILYPPQCVNPYHAELVLGNIFSVISQHGGGTDTEISMGLLPDT